jgi:hypothetical protein
MRLLMICLLLASASVVKHCRWRFSTITPIGQNERRLNERNKRNSAMGYKFGDRALNDAGDGN